jgi:hypothetical protein
MSLVLGTSHLEVAGVAVPDKVVVEPDHLHMILHPHSFVDGVDVLRASATTRSEAVDIRRKLCGNVSFPCNL